jgi:hypothetical protein
MNNDQTRVIEECARGSLSATLTFPEIEPRGGLSSGPGPALNSKSPR